VLWPGERRSPQRIGVGRDRVVNASTRGGQQDQPGIHPASSAVTAVQVRVREMTRPMSRSLMCRTAMLMNTSNDWVPSPS